MVSLIPALGTLASALPSASDLMTQVILGAGTSVVVAGLGSTAGQNAIDPLHLIFKTTTTAPNTPVAPATNIPTITAAAFASLPPASQAAVLAQGAHIV